MNIQEFVPLGPKTTMRIGGSARWYAELHSKEDVEEAWRFAQREKIPLIVLGGGSNTVFADGTIEAMVVRVKYDQLEIGNPASSVDCAEATRTHIGAGRILASLINELAEQNLDLSPLTGIPGTVGGAIFGNAGQNSKGIWIDSFVESVDVFDGKWKTMTKKECEFGYRDSRFKIQDSNPATIWKVTLNVPTRPAKEIKEEIERLIQRRIATQPHVKTAGSCFKAVGGTPAWKLIDAAGLRGKNMGGIQVAEKHANFLLNTGHGTFEDAANLVTDIQKQIFEPLDVEMRFIREDGTCLF